jgi:septum formation protein
MNTLPCILASSSPRRAELLKELLLDFRIVPSRVEELHHDQLTAGELAQANAFRKADSIGRDFPEALVIGADTLVYLEGKLFGKPQDLAEARQMLHQLQGQTHQVVTGVCLIHAARARRSSFAEVTDVTFKPLSPDLIDHYLESIDPLDKAGAYAIQQNGDYIVSAVRGSYSNVVGLPLERLRSELNAWGIGVRSTT